MKIEKWPSRYWAVYDDDDQLVCVTVYKKGAKEVIKRLTQLDPRNCPRCGFLSAPKQPANAGEIPRTASAIVGTAVHRDEPT
jgi:hypothetical protein